MHPRVCKHGRAAYISDDQETAMVAFVDSIDDGPCISIVLVYVHLLHFRVRTVLACKSQPRPKAFYKAGAAKKLRDMTKTAVSEVNAQEAL